MGFFNGKDIAMSLLAGTEHYSGMNNTGGHLLPDGVIAQQEGNPLWRDPTLSAPPQGRDLLGMPPKNRYESLLQAVGKSLLFSLIPDDWQTLKDSILATQAFNAEQKLNKTGAPTAVLFSTRW